MFTIRQYLLVPILSCLAFQHPLPESRVSGPSTLQRFEFRQIQMGTVFRILLHAQGKAEAERAAFAAFDRIAELDHKLSDYKTGSELMRACRRAAQEPVVVSSDLFTVLDRAQHFSRLSNGAFDVTVKPLLRLWRRAHQTGEFPAARDLSDARKKVGYRNLLLDPMTGSMRFQEMGMELDLGSIGKGYAADEALKTLANHGVNRALIDGGGDVRLGEPPPQREGWTIAVEGWEKVASLAGKRLLLHDAAIATSGNRHQFLDIGTTRYSHILDPATGLGMKDSRTVTVIAPDATTADAMATALSVLPPHRGIELIEELPGTEAYLVIHSSGKTEFFSSKNFFLDSSESLQEN